MSFAQVPVVVRSRDVLQEKSPQAQLLRPLIHRGIAPVGDISIGSVVMPGGGISEPHVHEYSEIIVLVLEGHAATLCGEGMDPVLHGPGDPIWVPAGVPHVAVNLSLDHHVVAIEVRTDPHFNKDVVLRPDLRDVAQARVPGLRVDHDEWRAKNWMV